MRDIETVVYVFIISCYDFYQLQGEAMGRTISFNIDVEKEAKITFLGHTVYRKPTGTDKYPLKNYNHHPGKRRRSYKNVR